MTWSTLIFAAAFVVFGLACFLMLFWPRHESGKLYTSEEAEQYLRELVENAEQESDGTGNPPIVPLILLTLITLLALALAHARQEI